MKRIAMALVRMVACGGALAQEARETTAGSFIICMGDSVCSLATDEYCSVLCGPAQGRVAQAWVGCVGGSAPDCILAKDVGYPKPFATPDELKSTAAIIVSTVKDMTKGRPLGFDDGQITGADNVFVGMCVMNIKKWPHVPGSRNILVGNYTSMPTASTNDFVNIANRLCFWRDTGQRVDCPPPEPDCTQPKETP